MDLDNDLSWPDFEKVTRAFRITTFTTTVNAQTAGVLPSILDFKGPFCCVMHMSPNDGIGPLVKTKVENGQFVPVPLEDMWPYLPRDEFAENMSN